MNTFIRVAIILSLAALYAASTAARAQTTDAQASDAESAEEQAPFRLNLPEWNPDPESLPPELRPLDVVRPALPKDVAAEIAELEARIADLEPLGLSAETREAQDAALDEAIALAERVLALRVEHQGNTGGAVRWRDSAGDSAEWYEVIEARQALANLRLLRGLDDTARAELASLAGTDAQVGRLYGAGDYAEAQAITERQLDIRRRILGEAHPSTLISIGNMGSMLRAQGQLAEAEPYYREALEGRRVLGGEHPSTLNSISNMGVLLWSQGKLSEAEPYWREALEVRRRVQGDEHPDTLISINNMGALLRSQGRLAEANPYYREALEGRRRVLGEAHLRTLESINNMGVLLGSQGRLSEAEPYRREALEGFRRVLGDEHASTLHSINNMGVLLQMQGKLSEAEPYQREALEIRRRVLGDAHLDTLDSINNMGYLLQSQGMLFEAEPYFREALEGSRRVLGEAHPSTLRSINNLGALLEKQGKSAEAEPYWRAALEGNRRVLGDAHPNTLASINNMGGLLKKQGKLAEAEPYYREALEARRRVLGGEHPDTLITINNMGVMLSDQGKLSDAEPLYREALEARRRLLGDEHPQTLISIGNMGLLLRAQGRLAEAEPYYREALEGNRRVLGGEHPDTLITINNMGVMLQAQGRLAEAEPYYREALSTAEKLRLDVIGDAQARAQFAGRLNLPGIASAYARTLVELGRAAEALGVLERGRGRAGLDMFAGGRGAAEEALRLTADPERLARYNAALEAEESAQRALFEAEARLSAASDEDKAEWTRRVQEARRSLNERTAAVFSELRGLVPTLDPLPAERILATLAPGEALLTYAFTDESAIALVARDGEVTGVTLAKDRDEAAALRAAVADLRSAIASRPVGGEAMDVGVAAAARKAAAPEELRALLEGAGSVIIVADGPLAGLPMELLLEDLPIAYAPSATIALRPRLDGDARSSAIASSAPLGAGVVLGDPVFAGFEREEPDYPEAGVLLTMVTQGSNAAIAGLTRGDVLLSYGEHELASAEDLGPAMDATTEALTTRGVTENNRPIIARAWRLGEDGQGEEIEVALATGSMGVVPSQAPPADGLRSMATFDRSADTLAANASALEQIRFYGGGLSPLPNTRLEAAAIAAMLGEGATLLLGADATAPRLREAVESNPPRVLHLATHGLLGSADRPLLASLALTAPDEPTGDDNGFVTLGDILATWGAQLGGTELVALSACDTAHGVRQGDTMMALPLGLLIAGADSVLASLWKVDDRATALLMARFYANWLGKAESAREIDGVRYSAGEAMPKMAALREAQVWLRSLTAEDLDRLQDDTGQTIAQSVSRDPRPRPAPLAATPKQTSHPYDHPYYWAAFVLYGSPD
ncbi:MAG: CHAT domain-containing protein [Phycisphaeraceae bacterium]|nr:MAG: CHAT domain-containing protein [Phycisphaeraceae bacterium]